jgi:TolB protein
VTGESEVLSQQVVLAFFWSPDGRKIAYFTLGSLPGDGVQALVRPDNTRVRSKPRVQHPELKLDVWVVDLVDRKPLRIATFVPSDTFLTQFLPYFDQYALSHRIWSPSSDALVIPMVRDGGSKIVIVPINGEDSRSIAVGTVAFWSHQ